MTRGDSAKALLKASELFDSEGYLARYPDVRMLRMDPVEHYLRIGAQLLRDPSVGFDTSYYVSTYPEVVSAGLNPLLHYLEHGRSEGRQCLPPGSTYAVVAPVERQELPVPSARVTFAGSRAKLPGTKTVLVCAHMSTQQLFGGERSLLDILDGFADAGYNVVVSTPGSSNPAYMSALQERCLALISFEYGWWSRGREVDEQVVAEFCGVIAEFAVDAVHSNTIMLREPLMAARRMGVPAVVHARELIEHDVALLDHIGESPVRVRQQVLNLADWIIANSEATAASFQRAGSTIVIPNTVDARAFDIPPRRSGGKLAVGMLSSNLPKKGLSDFVEVARVCEKELPSVRFVLMGPENEHTILLKLGQSEGDIPGNLRFAGYFEDPTKAMDEVDLLLNLSYFQESFGRTVLEAMAARRPAIVYDWGAPPELVVEGKTGFVVPFRDVGAVAHRIRQLCGNSSRLRKMGRAARRRAVELYDKPHYAGRLGQAYERILGVSSEVTAPLTLPARNGSGLGAGESALRIAYFLWHFPVPSETFVLNELRILVAQGHDVRVFCRQSPHKDFTPDFEIAWEQVADSSDLADKLVASGRNLVHSHFTYPTVTDMVWPACEQAGIPFTFIAHAQDIFRYSNDERNRVGEIGRSPWCQRVLVPSRFHRKYLEERGVPAEKLLINPNGIDPDLYLYSGSGTPSGLRTRRSICAIHRFTEKKGLENLILAGKQLAADGIAINLYGYGDLAPRYRELIEREQLDNVFVHGPVRDRAHMLEVFGEHDLFACPSLRASDGDMDGIPTVLMEAMASGLAVIATAVSGIPDLVRDGVTGILCEAGAPSLVHGVRRFYSMPDWEVAAMVEEAGALIRRDYHVGRLTHALLRLWRHETIDVMIVSWNNVTELREVVRRLYRFTTSPFHLAICDNGSAPDVAVFLCELYARHDNVTVVFNRENVMVGPGTNICLENSNSRYAVYVCGKEGFVLNFGWESKLVDYMDAHPQVGLAGTLCYSPSYLFGRLYPKAIALFPDFRNTAYATDNGDRVFSHVQGGFFVMRREMYDAIGGFSDAVAHSYTDVEYSYYAESMGWGLGRAPGLLALYNKTRPGILTRIDESIGVVHPPTLDDLPLLDAIAGRTTRFCSLCGWNGPEFATSPATCYQCPSCGSRPVDRSVFRYLAESILTYRRLPALGVGVGTALAPFWREQFLGDLIAPEDFKSQLDAGQADPGNRGLKFVYLDIDWTPTHSVDAVLQMASAAIAMDGVVLLRPAPEGTGSIEEVLHGARACGLTLRERVRFSSEVSRYDALPLLVLQKAAPCAC